MGIRLGEICKFQSGGTPAKGKADYFNGNIPWITTTALNGSQIDESDAVDWITEKAIQESAAKIVPAFSIMVGTRVGVGKVAVNTVDMSTSQDIISLIGIDERVWSKDFLCKFLQGKSIYLNSQARGATIKGIKMDVLAALELPSISLEEQQHISSVIDATKYIISSRQYELQKLDELVKARFVEMFGDPEFNTEAWPILTLDKLCNVGSSKRIYQNEQSREGVPFWRISDLVNKMDTGAADSGLFIPEERYMELKQAGLVPIPGDILVTSRGTLGRCYIIKDEDRFYFQDGMISWLSDYADSITPLYLQYLFARQGFRKQIDSMQAGSTVAYLSIAMLKKLRVMIPPIEAQKNFAAFVDQLDKSKVVLQDFYWKMSALGGDKSLLLVYNIIGFLYPHLLRRRTP